MVTQPRLFRRALAYDVRHHVLWPGRNSPRASHHGSNMRAMRRVAYVVGGVEDGFSGTGTDYIRTSEATESP